jgi:hypothetical protein
MTDPYLNSAITPLILQAKADAERHEGYADYAYPDPLSKIARTYRGPDWPWGKVPARTLLARIQNVNEQDGAPWTVGFGFTNMITPDSTTNRIQAERKLEGLILAMDTALNGALTWYKGASFVTKTVLIDMGFNLGLRGLLGFRNTLAAIGAKNYQQAARNMELSAWYAQVGVRAKELVQRMRTQTIEPQHKIGPTV